MSGGLQCAFFPKLRLALDYKKRQSVTTDHKTLTYYGYGTNKGDPNSHPPRRVTFSTIRSSEIEKAELRTAFNRE